MQDTVEQVKYHNDHNQNQYHSSMPTKVLLTLNMDVSNKPATKELHLTKGQNSYIHQVHICINS